MGFLLLLLDLSPRQTNLEDITTDKNLYSYIYDQTDSSIRLTDIPQGLATFQMPVVEDEALSRVQNTRKREALPRDNKLFPITLKILVQDSGPYSSPF